MHTSRRRFLKAGIASACFPNIIRAEDANPSGRLRVAVMGLNRGRAHIQNFAKVPNVEIACVCDVDAVRLGQGADLVEKLTGKKPQAVADFRRILDDKNIDALSIATPNFWHAPATILACQAGKHVYVEKPGSYCAGEAERMVAVAARPHPFDLARVTRFVPPGTTLAAIVAAVWYGFKYIGRLKEARDAQVGRPARKPRWPGKRRSETKADEAEDMVQCPVCQAYVPARSAQHSTEVARNLR